MTTRHHKLTQSVVVRGDCLTCAASAFQRGIGAGALAGGGGGGGVGVARVDAQRGRVMEPAQAGLLQQAKPSACCSHTGVHDTTMGHAQCDIVEAKVKAA